jgi:hypothetical protein
MNTSTRRHIWALVCLLLAMRAEDTPAETPANGSTSAADGTEWVRALVAGHEVVAVGTLEFDYKGLSPDFYEKSPRQIVGSLRVTRGYKGVSVGDTVRVQFTSDMLQVPGESISAGAKRDLLWEGIRRRRAANREALAALESSMRVGRVTQANYATEHARLLSEGEEIGRASAQLSTAKGVRPGGQDPSFFDLGGVLRPGAQYLIAANRPSGERKAVYFLSYLHGGVYWGEKRDHIAGLLEAIDSAR